MPDYRVSNAAKRDIQEIGRYTQREWGKDQRRKYLAELEQRLQTLASSPLLASERTEFDPPVRIFPFEQHLIVYRIDEPGIFVLRVLHRRMDVPEQLEEH